MRFEKISYKQWYMYLAANTSFTEDEIKEAYDNIQLPKAGSEYAAGHDFYAPITVWIGAKGTYLIPTGIRWVTDEEDKNKCLIIAPRSGLGTKYGMRLTNTIGIIDADYYCATNEGHIMASVTAEKELHINAGDRFVQGIIVPYYRCGGESNEKRVGGFGSTGVK